jgi:ribosomal protein S18 acetylase RimI-like enzyme
MADANFPDSLQAGAVILTHELPAQAELVSLYASVQWTSYTRDPEALERAVRQSSFVVCARSDDGELLGLARAVSDDVSVCYVQDVLVRPEAHRQGVGRSLMRAVLTRYAHVMQQVLLTDDGEAQQAFYRSLGLHNTRDLTRNVTNCFYRDTRSDLS